MASYYTSENGERVQWDDYYRWIERATTDAMIAAIVRDVGGSEQRYIHSLLDIGAGDGRVLVQLGDPR